MQTLSWSPRFAEKLNRSWRSSLIVRAFSSSSSDFSNQSRGGLPRFYSEVLPPLKGGLLRVLGDEFWHMTKELGAKSVTPLLTERSPSISENRVDRLQRVILVSTKQCQWLHEMTLNPPTKICGLLPIVSQSKLSLVAVAEATPVISALTSFKMESAGLMIIGPEGDFTEEELNLIVEAGATAVGLGPHRLRVETATMTLLAALMLWSDSQHICNPSCAGIGVHNSPSLFDTISAG